MFLKTYVKELLVTTISQSLGEFGFIRLGLINCLVGLKSSLKIVIIIIKLHKV